ncbi:MAG: glycosyltransferase, partial [Chitinivibrionales bacterium]|nr:glycosyltransferase [Chitinivibrionales bacterium]
MRACMVAYTFYEGDNRVRRYGEALARRGDEVDALTLRQDDAPSQTVVNGVRVHKIQRRAPNEHHKYDYLLRLLAFLLHSAWTLTVLHARRRYDLIHVHSIPDFEVFAALFAKLTGAKVILDIHDSVPELYAGKFGATTTSPLFRLLVLIERFSGGFADHVIVANHIWRERIVARSVAPRKCTVIMNYPDPAIFRERRGRRKDDAFVLLYPGTLSRHQGIGTAIRALTHLRDVVPHVELHIYGGGTDE